MSCGTGAYVRLMEQYPLVTEAFLNLAEPYQKVSISLSQTRFTQLELVVTQRIVPKLSHFCKLLVLQYDLTKAVLYLHILFDASTTTREVADSRNSRNQRRISTG